MPETPSQSQPGCICHECNRQKNIETREAEHSSTTEQSKSKHQQGTGDFGPFSGDVDRKSSDKNTTTSKNRATGQFYICSTPGCSQRELDRWTARRWKLKNDPNLDDSPEMQDREIERIKNEEGRFRSQAEQFAVGTQTEGISKIEKEEQRHQEQREQRHRDRRNRTKNNSSRRSDNRSRDNNIQSRQSDQETTANGWGAADADRSSTRLRDSNSQSQQSNQQTTANGCGTADADRSSNRSRKNRDAFRNDVDTRASQTTNGNEAFADNVYDDEAQTAAERDAFQDSIDPEELDEEETDTNNYSRSRSHKHP